VAALAGVTAAWPLAGRSQQGGKAFRIGRRGRAACDNQMEIESHQLGEECREPTGVAVLRAGGAI